MSAVISVVLLPGMDGTGRLFEPFIAELPSSLRPVVVSYPPERALGYAELEPHVEAACPVAEPFVILAESFSGPLAVRMAARGDSRLMAIVLVASFVRSPTSRWMLPMRWLVGPWCFQFAPSAWVIRRFLAGDDAPDDLVASVRAAAGTVSPHVMAKRLRQVMEVEDRAILRQIRVPVLSLSGSQDRLVSARNSDDLRALGDRIESVVLDTPHLVLQRQPAAAARIIDEFLRRKVPNSTRAIDTYSDER